MYEVTIQRTIQVGCVYKIHPCEAFLGIDEGVIRIKAIYDVPALDKDCLEQAQIYLDTISPDADETDIHEVMDQPWVAYQYVRVLLPGTPSAETFYLPLDIFSNLITMY